MSRPFYMTDKMRNNLVEKFNKRIHEAMLYDKTISIKPEFDRLEAPVDLVFDPVAFCKIYTLVQTTDKEIAWFGVVEKLDKARYFVKDVLLYPQKVTSVTVDSDDDELSKWMCGLDFDVANQMHLHGHSHVDMGVSPSYRDIGDQLKTLKQLGSKGFYIFMIMNKHNSFFFKIVDMDDNMVYDTNDVDLIINGPGFDVESWLNEVDSMVYDKHGKQEVSELPFDIEEVLV